MIQIYEDSGVSLRIVHEQVAVVKDLFADPMYESIAALWRVALRLSIQGVVIWWKN